MSNSRKKKDDISSAAPRPNQMQRQSKLQRHPADIRRSPMSQVNTYTMLISVLSFFDAWNQYKFSKRFRCLDFLYFSLIITLTVCHFVSLYRLTLITS